MGVKTYRLSISWSRILPNGYDVNRKGIEHYKEEIGLLLQMGITPFVTLYHWDLPQVLQDEGGWMNESIVEHFVRYADVMFDHFPEVEHWITMNEIYVFSYMGYGTGVNAPGWCSDRSRVLVLFVCLL